MNVIAIGDICGAPGISILQKRLPMLRRDYNADFAIVNGENAAVNGITPDQAEEIYRAGADVITLGNHSWNRREIIRRAEDDRFLLRPANFGPLAPGHGYGVYPAGKADIAVISLMGRWQIDANADNPFICADKIIKNFPAHIKHVFVDFHAEATSEKTALANYLDGRVSGVFGTHTHVQTADERILPKGTGFICDAGMTGPVNSVLGIKVNLSIGLFMGAPPVKLESAEGECMINGVFFRCDENGRCVEIERINIIG